MLPFGYVAAGTVRQADELMAANPDAMFIAGGTDMLQLLREAVLAPGTLIDITGPPLDGIRGDGDGLRIGALSRMSDVADDERVQRDFPALAQALNASASAQVRNMATIGGNLLQRTRCLYFRDAAVPCNKRIAGSGCPARDGQNRMNAILGGSADCIATYAGDMANALLVLDAELVVHGPHGERRLPVEQLHRAPGSTPHIETVLQPDEIIEEVVLPASAHARNSHYLKLRDRASFEWALVSVAIAVEIVRGKVREARVAVGGVATRPWRLPEVEQMLTDQKLDEAGALRAGQAASKGAEPRPGNAFKVMLLQRAVQRALMIAGGLS